MLKRFVAHASDVPEIECAQSGGAPDNLEGLGRLGADCNATEVEGTKPGNLGQRFKMGFLEGRGRAEVGVEHGFPERAARGLGDGKMDGD